MARAILFFDARCNLCRMAREWIELALPDVGFEDTNDTGRAAVLGVRDIAQLRERMCLLTGEGEFWGYDAFVRLVALSPAAHSLAGLLALRPINALGHRVYDWIARSRACAATAACPQSSP